MDYEEIVLMGEAPNWGIRSMENAIQALRWALDRGNLSTDDRSRARRALYALEGD